MIPTSIETPRLLLVEGRDEEEFFKALLKHISVRDVQVMNYGGKAKLREHFRLIAKAPGFGRLSLLAIMRDANSNASSAFQSVCDVLRHFDMPHPDVPGELTSDTKPRVGVFVLPGQERPGMLEDLCLSTVAMHPVLGCVERYMECLTERVDDIREGPRNESKARAHAFLAGMPEIVNSVGLAAHRGYWDLDASALQDLRSFLEALGN